MSGERPNTQHDGEDPSQGRMWSRLVRVESVVASLSSTVDRFIEASSKRDREMYDRFDRLQRDFQTSRQANWPVVIGAISLVLIFAGMMAGLVMFSTRATLSPLEIQVHSSRQQIDLLRQEAAKVPVLDSRVKTLEAEVDRLRRTERPLSRPASP